MSADKGRAIMRGGNELLVTRPVYDAIMAECLAVNSGKSPGPHPLPSGVHVTLCTEDELDRIEEEHRVRAMQMGLTPDGLTWFLDEMQKYRLRRATEFAQFARSKDKANAR